MGQPIYETISHFQEEKQIFWLVKTDVCLQHHINCFIIRSNDNKFLFIE